MKLEIKHSGLSQFPRRRELPHQRQKVMMVSSVEVELNLTHKLYPDPLVLQFLALQIQVDLGR